MNRTIWKYPLLDTDDQYIEAPDNAQPITVQVQRGRPCLWMLVDPDAFKRTYHVKMFGTGHIFKDVENFSYVGSYQLYGGDFVGHVFIAKE